MGLFKRSKKKNEEAASEVKGAVVNEVAETEEERAKYKDMPLPAITVIPSAKGSLGYGMANIKSAVERAVGADILFKDSE